MRISAAGYRLGAVIGIGTYGEVRYARHEATQQRVAIKIIDPSRFREETTQQLMKEIKILRMIDHPNCIRLIEIRENVSFRGTFCESCACTEFKPQGLDCANCSHSGSEHSHEETRRVMFVVQELAAGGELFSLLMHSGPLQEELARFYFAQLLDGLHYLHRKGISHRDLKPENLVLDAQFNLKIIDFGLAALNPSEHEAGAKQQPLFHSGVGSQPYSAPEVYYQKELYGGHGYRGPPADVWSAGVILFTVLAGRPPFIRPLAKTYGHSMRRCKHFINLIQGTGYVNSMSLAVRGFMDRIFRMEADKRATVEQLRQDEWLQPPMLSNSALSKMMDERVRATFQAQGKPELLELLADIQSEYEPTPCATDSDVFSFMPRGLRDNNHAVPANNTVDCTNSTNESTHCASPKISPKACPVLPFDFRAEAQDNDPFRGANIDVSLLTISDDAPVFRSLPPSSFSSTVIHKNKYISSAVSASSSSSSSSSSPTHLHHPSSTTTSMKVVTCPSRVRRTLPRLNRVRALNQRKRRFGARVCTDTWGPVEENAGACEDENEESGY
jgi:serine/threonine protein kinase